MATKDVALDKVRKLINLAAQDSPEGRVAAWRACAFIRDYGLDVVDPDDPALYEPPPNAPAFTATQPVQAQSPFGIRIMTSKYEGKCRYCGGRYFAGDRVIWKKGIGCWHTGGCWDRWDQVMNHAGISW